MNRLNMINKELIKFREDSIKAAGIPEVVKKNYEYKIENGYVVIMRVKNER